MNERDKNEIIKLLGSIPDEFRVIENRISSDLVNEYYELLDKLGDENQPVNLMDLENWKDLKSEKGIKELLVRLSAVGDIKSYRKIEEIIQSKNLEILDFAYVALKFARLNLENQLTDEPIGFISSGLGGKGNKLRYYFAIKSEKKIERKKELKIVKELQKICGNSESEFEEIENHGKFVLIKILISIDFAIGNVIVQLINNCPFVDEEYLCTNVEKPTIEFVNKWINEEIE